MRKIRILHIIKSLGRGGAEMLLPETLSLHDQVQFEFHYIYFLPWKDQLVQPIKKAGGTVVCFAADNNIVLIAQFNKIIKYISQHKIDIIHSHLPWAGFVSRIIFKKYGVPVIYSEHNKQERYHWLTRHINKFTYNWQSIVIAVSEDVNDSIISNIKPLIKVKTILNGVNTMKFNPISVNSKDVRTKLSIPQNAPVLGNVAVFRAQKRLDVWLEQAAIIKKTFPLAHFILVGDGPLESMVLEKIEEFGLRECVHLPGRLEDVRPWLATMDIFMVSSEFEGLPIALLEAMSMGLPVVSTDAGGIKEVIRHKENGWLVPVDKVGQISEGVIQLLRNSDKVKQLGKAGRNEVVNHFSINRMVSQLEDVYINTVKCT